MADVVALVNEPLLIEIWQGNDWTVVTYGEDTTVYGNIAFISLADTPNSYAGQKGKTPVVNEDENGLEFQEVIGRTFTNLKDCPPNYENAGLKFVRVNGNENGLEFITVKTTDITVFPFLDLSDTPNKYDGAGGKLVRVTPAENGLDFIDYESVVPEILRNGGTYVCATVTVDKKGRVTAIHSGTPGTVLPPFTPSKLLIGDGTNIPAEFANATEEHKYLMTYIDTANNIVRPEWAYVSSLYSTAGNLTLTCSETGNVGHYLQIHASQDGLTLVPRSPAGTNTNINLNLIPQARGKIVLGNASTTSVDVSTNLNMGGEICSENTLMLRPKVSGTIRVDSSQLMTNNYTDNVAHRDDLTNKGYVDTTIDRKIDEAISQLSGQRTIKATKPTRITYDMDTVNLGSIPKNSVIEEVKLYISEAFADTIEATIGDNIDNDFIMEGFKLNRLNSYQLNTFVTLSKDTNVKLFFTGERTPSGEGYVYIKYFTLPYE